VWERIQKIAISKHLKTHFKAKREKGLGTPFTTSYHPTTVLFISRFTNHRCIKFYSFSTTMGRMAAALTSVFWE